MCGRFAVTTDPARLAEQVHAVNEAPAGEFAPNYNVAPTAIIATVVTRHSEPDDEPTRRVRLMRWGLVPPWTKAGPDGAPEPKGPQLINARADKVATSPVFRASAQHKRCLIPMDGFYEWRPDAAPMHNEGTKGRKTPFYTYRGDGQMLFMAGLWSVWKATKDSHPLLSCTIITTDAVGQLAGIHHRMPLIVAEGDWDRWLDPDASADPALLAAPADVRGLALREVSTLVNNVRNNGPELIEPAGPRPEQARLP